MGEHEAMAAYAAGQGHRRLRSPLETGFPTGSASHPHLCLLFLHGLGWALLFSLSDS